MTKKFIDKIQLIDAINEYLLNPDGSIGTWDVTGITDFSNLFKNKTTFNEDISGWNVSGVTNMNSMFAGAKSFNHPLPWDVSRVTTMHGMFYQATSFDQPLRWNVGLVTDMGNMFHGAVDFDNGDEPLDWDVSSVRTMRSMFRETTYFNQPLPWDVSNVTTMEEMFCRTRSFNQNINNWDVSKVVSMKNMFMGSSAFDSPLDKWNLESLRQAQTMFFYSYRFNQPLGAWHRFINRKLIDITNMFVDSNYSQDLSSWTIRDNPSSVVSSKQPTEFYPLTFSQRRTQLVAPANKSRLLRHAAEPLQPRLVRSDSNIHENTEALTIPGINLIGVIRNNINIRTLETEFVRSEKVPGDDCAINSLYPFGVFTLEEARLLSSACNRTNEGTKISFMEELFSYYTQKKVKYIPYPISHLGRELLDKDLPEWTTIPFTLSRPNKFSHSVVYVKSPTECYLYDPQLKDVPTENPSEHPSKIVLKTGDTVHEQTWLHFCKKYNYDVFGLFTFVHTEPGSTFPFPTFTGGKTRYKNKRSKKYKKRTRRH